MRHDKANNKDTDFTTALKAILFGVAVGAAICAGFLFLFAFLFVAVKSIPQFMIQTTALVCSSVGAFVSGYISIRIYHSKGLVCGAFAGFLLFAIITLIAFIISRDKFTYITLIRLLAMVFFGAVGGILGVNKRRRK